jgi:hypothetical protein
VLLFCTCACASPARKLSSLYQELRTEVEAADPVGGPAAGIEERHTERARTVRKLIAEGALVDTQQRFEAAVLLAETQDPADLDLAIELAFQAAEEGDRRGFRVAAEAIDKQLMLAGRLQRYGTQYVRDPLLSKWRLYPLDPATTDAERARMGVPSQAELIAAEQRLNQAEAKSAQPR